MRNADMSGLVDLLLTVVDFFKNTSITFKGTSVSLWAVFVSGAAASAVMAALFGGGKDAD